MATVIDDVWSATAAEAPGTAPAVALWRLSVDQYHEMARVGVLKSGDPVELIDGLLVRKASKSPRHSVASFCIRRAIESCTGALWHVQVQNPIRLDASEPEPDVAVVRGMPENYLDDHPTPVNLPVIVEISDVILEWDKTQKREIYARNQIREYWIVNLIDSCVDVFTEPSGPVETPHYKTQRIYRPGESVPLVIDGTTCGNIEVSEILPPSG